MGYDGVYSSGLISEPGPLFILLSTLLRITAVCYTYAIHENNPVLLAPGCF